MTGLTPSVPERDRLARLIARRNRLFWASAILLVLACILPAIVREVGSHHPAGYAYEWADSTIFLHNDDNGATCTMTRGKDTTRLHVSRDTLGMFGISGLDVATADTATITCNEDLVITNDPIRTLTYPIRYFWAFALVVLGVLVALTIAVIQVSFHQQRQAWNKQ